MRCAPCDSQGDYAWLYMHTTAHNTLTSRVKREIAFILCEPRCTCHAMCSYLKASPQHACIYYQCLVFLLLCLIWPRSWTVRGIWSKSCSTNVLIWTKLCVSCRVIRLQVRERADFSWPNLVPFSTFWLDSLFARLLHWFPITLKSTGMRDG